MSNTAQRSRKRRKKDPNAPKRAMSAYMYYAASRRDALKEENPTKKMTEIAQMIGSEWQTLDETERSEFQAKASKDKARYVAEMATYVPSVEHASTRQKRDPNAPKRPLSAFLFWASVRRPELRAQNPDKKMTELAVMLGEEWQKASDSDKEPYLTKARADKERYEREKAVYLDSK